MLGDGLFWASISDRGEVLTPVLCPVLAWTIGNVTAQMDRNDNVFPRKERPNNKIDPAVALIMAAALAMSQEVCQAGVALIAAGYMRAATKRKGQVGRVANPSPRSGG